MKFILVNVFPALLIGMLSAYISIRMEWKTETFEFWIPCILLMGCFVSGRIVEYIART